MMADLSGVVLRLAGIEAVLVRIANVMERDEARRTDIYFLEQRASSTSKPDEASGMAFTPAKEEAVDQADGATHTPEDQG